MPKAERTEFDCPKCEYGVLYTKDSRPVHKDGIIRRRRKKCDNCDYLCSTHEIIISDAHGFSNSYQRRITEFLKDIDTIARDKFGDENGYFLGDPRPRRRDKT